ncbi:putative ER-golgi SNARE complex subunit [Pyronema domesticum]|uniref:Similar to Integral membrane protein sed5 acc. no. O13644 n=1 Tax=Pyronema omphalodes (strain CBS 100304) TaxID=1076935 RepID=U4L1X7_PYROM|nr:putative ER-golgi SNARE complex subunit [Pyronema domesticum]CCX09656.1 Similar to Integral membrane protein sed5; acc. no. O13644 [Pyronema omphalodes CBS 100304]
MLLHSSTMSIQDRTAEFHTLTSAVKKRLRTPGQQQRLLSEPSNAVTKHSRGEFARRAATIGKSITDTMGKLERLAQLAKRKALFDDKPVEIAELTYVIKQDLGAINSQISSLQTFVRSGQQGVSSSSAAQEHSKNVVVMLQGKLADVSVGFKDVLETRTKNIQASRARTEQFVSGVRPVTPVPNALASHSPLYHTPSGTPGPQGGNGGGDLLLSIDPPQQSAQQLMLMEEGAGGQGSYIQARGQAIEAIETTINELGGIFGQLAQMVSEQKEMIQRIDHETEDVVANIEGGQRELLKYFASVSNNRWLMAKMFGVLMIFFLLWVLVSG